MKIGFSEFRRATRDMIVDVIYSVVLITAMLSMPILGFLTCFIGSFHLINPEMVTAWDGSRWLKSDYTGGIIFLLGGVGGVLGLIAGFLIGSWQGLRI